MWEKEKEKVISLIYLWWNEGMLNASEHAAVVILSGKMKCLHSRLSEEQGNERGGDRKLEGERESGGWVYCRRVLTISSLPHHRTRHKMATSLLLTTGTECVCVCGGGIWTTAISSPTSVAYSSTSTISHIYGLVSCTTLLSGFFTYTDLQNWINQLNPHFLIFSNESFHN